MPASRPTTRSHALLLAVATLITAAAALAIGILLLGDFGGTEGRVLLTTLSLAGYGALCVPATILWDRRRLRGLATAGAGLSVLAAAMNGFAIWAEPGEDFGKAFGTVVLVLIPTVVASALAARRLHPLFAPFVAVSALVTSLAVVAVWAEIERDGYLRVLGALVVLDVLLVALQPLLLRAARRESPRDLRVADTSGRTEDVVVRAASVAEAVAQAIRTIEREGRHVRTVEVLEHLESSGTGSQPR